MIITQTPLRMSFVGGGTDLRSYYAHEDGRVCSTVIDKYIYVIVKERFDDRIVLAWSKKENVGSVDEIQHELIREALRKTQISKGIEIITTADIPSEGSGLGSSSALTVGLLHALHLYQSIPVSAEQLAREACEIEIEILKKPIGKQDHYAAAFGGFREYIFKKDESVENHALSLNKETMARLESSLLLLYTNKTRSANDILKEQKSNTEKNLDLLTKMRNLGEDFKKAFEKGDLDRIGEILHEQWTMKRKLASTVSSGEIDDMYERARKAGATGGKILGAGGGGFMLLYCPQSARDRVKTQLKEYPPMPFQFESDGSRAIFNIKRNTWKI